MAKLKSAFRKFMTGFIALVLVGVYPALPVLADSSSGGSGTTVVCPTAYGTTSPTGASASTFTYNPKTCLWENNYFTWSPVTKQYTPKFAQPYTYNNATGLYDAPNWVYNAATGKYDPATISVATPPAGATVIGGPPAADTISGTGSGSSNTINSNGSGGNNSVSNTGPDSSNTINNNGNGSTDLNDNSTVGVGNTIGSTAISGDATVNTNTSGGSATSGGATADANVINLLQSNTNLQGNVATFTYNINGNVQGDIYIDPSQLSSANSTTADPSNLTVNSSTNAAINNDVNLNAASGNANVSDNTTAGNATSGAANAVADIINVINSIISSGQSFVGTINIYGNFDGDILLPQNTLNNILAANYPTVNATVSPNGTVSVINNTGPNSSNGINNSGSSNTNINNSNNTGINNQVNLKAASGDAAVSDNTSAGSATTGSAATNLVLLNLTGQQIICGDALLVFVNVLGNWVGMIVNAPAGSTAAALGGGTCVTSSMPSGNTNINSTNNSTINNNLNVGSQSGNATVSDNTTGGNATSGDATASANIANISNSALSFNSWFGILFINVFGTWNGSFGINTAAGNKPLATTGGSGAGGSKVFSFVSKSGGSGSGATFIPIGSNSISNTGPNSHNKISAVSGSTSQDPPAAFNTAKAKAATGGASSVVLLVGGATFLSVMAVGGLAQSASRVRDNLTIRRINSRTVQGRRRAWLRFTIF